MRFVLHVLAIPHTISRKKDYVCCAFTQKVVKFCTMMKKYTNNVVIHYGHSQSEVDCDEHVTVISDEDQKCYEDNDWKTQYYKHDMNDEAHQKFNIRCIEELEKRTKRGDFILCFWGLGHQAIAERFSDKCIIVEPGIGCYAMFAPYRVFESYACMHVNYGKQNLDGQRWYDAVIPNYFDLNDFEYSEEKDGYILFLGRTIKNKGVELAVDIAKRTNHNLIIAGQGQVISDDPQIKFVGPVNTEERRILLSRAKCVIVPTYYIEPFGGVAMEAMLSGTPVITTDWGAFTETVLHGHTGYRCRNMDHFVWAVNNISSISPKKCREWAENYSLENVSKMYQEYFYSLSILWDHPGFYEPNPNRKELDWMTKVYPYPRQSSSDDEQS